VWSEKAHHHRHYQPFVWRPLPAPYEKMTNFPKNKLALRTLILRLLALYGAGRYRVLRSHFSTESSGDWRPVIYWVVRPDGKYRLIKRYSEHKSHLGTDSEQAFWKLPQRRLLITTDSHEQLRNRKARMLKALETRVQKPKPYVHTIRSSTSNRPWKVTVTAQTRRYY